MIASDIIINGVGDTTLLLKPNLKQTNFKLLMAMVLKFSHSKLKVTLCIKFSHLYLLYVSYYQWYAIN